MRFTAFVTLSALAGAVTPLLAQERTHETRVLRFDSGSEEHRAALGVGVSSTGSLRDTLGLMITSVTRGGPAERAGLQEGNRIASVNGVSLRADRADIEDVELSGALTHRLTRELSKRKPGDEVELSVYRDGRTTSMKVRTADSDSIFQRRGVVRASHGEMNDRPALGFGIGNTGSSRDTLGVFVMSVADSTPAARAGLEEGNRIAAINGVNLRVAASDAGDGYLGNAKAQRLRREITQLKVGEDVTLRVYANGQFRDVHMKVARAGDLPRRNRGMMFMGEGMDLMSPMPPMPPMPLLGPEFEHGMEELHMNLDRLGTELPRILKRVRLPGMVRTTIM